MARPDRPGFPGPRNIRPTEAFETFPIISGVNPASDRATGGTSITITGQRFVGGATVYFGDVPGENVVVVNSTTITVDAPEQTSEGVVDITVTNPNGELATLSQGFTYIVGHITGVSISRGSTIGGTELSIFGVNLVAGSSISFDGEVASSIVFVDSTLYRCITPAHDNPGLVDIVIVEPDGAIVIGKKLFGYTSKIFKDDIRRSPSVSIQESTNGGVNSASFNITGDGVPPIGGERTSLADKEGNTLFAGQVTGLSLTHEGERTARVWTATASGWEWRFNKRRAFGVYNNVSASDVAEDIIERYCPGFTTTFIQQRLPLISMVLDGSIDNTTILTEICEKLGFGKCYIDNDRNVHLFVPPFDPPSPPTGTLGFGAAAMTVTESAIASNGYPSFKPGYWQFYSAFKYVPTKTYTAPHASVPVPPSPGYVLVSDQARDLNLLGYTSNGSYGLGFKRGWVMYDASGALIPEGWPGHQPPVAGDVVFASQDVATVLEDLGGGGTFESRLSALSGPTYFDDFLPTFDNIPLGPMVGSRNCTQREIYAVRYGEIEDEVTPPDPIVTVAALINPTVACIAQNGNGVGIGSGVLFNQKWAYSYSGADSYAGVPANTTALSPFSPVLTPNGTRRHIQVPYSTDPGCKFVVLWRSLANDSYATVRTYTNDIGGDDAFVYPNNPAGGMLDVMIDGTGLTDFFDDVPGFVNRSSGVVTTTRQVGSGLQHYYTIDDNVTTGPITPIPDISSAKVPARTTTPPLAPLNTVSAAESTTAIDDTLPLESEAQPGYWAFRVTGLYKDGTESRGTEQTAPVLLTGTYKAALSNLPIFPDVGSVPCVARMVYAAVFEPTSPLVEGVPDFSIANSKKVAILLDNTATTAEVQFGTSIVGGERKYNNLPPGAEDDLGPNLESVTDPDDIDDDNDTLLLDPPVVLSVDLTQLRNRVFVKGKGTIMARDAAIGDTTIQVFDVSAFSSTGGKVATGHLVLDYKSITETPGSALITLSKPLTQPILQADWKFGGGTPVRPIVIVEDLESQAFFAYVEVDDNGEPSDGVHEYMLIDDKLSTQLQMYNAGLAELKAAWPIREVTYATRDPKSRKGRTVHFDLSDPPIYGDFVITDVNIDQYYDESEVLTPRYNITATTVSRVTLHDYLKMVGAPRDEFNGFGGIIDTAKAAFGNDPSGFPVRREASIYVTTGTGVADPVLSGYPLVGAPSAAWSFDQDEAPPPALNLNSFDTRWMTAATTAVNGNTQSQSLAAANAGGCSLENEIDVWVWIKTPKVISNIILWPLCLSNVGMPAAAISNANTSMLSIRYANFSGTQDSGWVIVLQKNQAGTDHLAIPVGVGVAPWTEYIIRLQSFCPGRDITQTSVKATINGVSKTVTYAETADATLAAAPKFHMPVGQTTVVGLSPFIGVSNKGTAIRKISFRKFYSTTD